MSSPTTPEEVGLKIQLQADHLAAYKQALLLAISGRDSDYIWSTVDLPVSPPAQVAANMTYENRVKGSQMTIVDTRLQDVSIGSRLSEWFSLHRDYFATDLGLASGWTSFLSDVGWRVHEYFGDLYYENFSQRLGAAYLWPNGDSLLGHVNVTSALTDHVITGATGYEDGPEGGAICDTSRTGPGVISTVVVENTIGGSNLAFTLTVYLADGETTHDVTVTVTNGSVVGTAFPVGRVSVTTGDLAVGATAINVSSTAPFIAGEKALLVDPITGSSEVITISTVSGTVNVASPGLKYEYYLANTPKLYPLYSGVKELSVSTYTNTDQIEFTFQGDRTLSLS